MGNFDYRNRYVAFIKNVFLDCEQLQKLIKYPQSNPYTQPSLNNPYELFEDDETKKIFFSKKAYKITDNAESKILISFIDSPNFGGGNFKNIDIIFSIAVHNSIIELEDGSNRISEICNHISNYINGYKHLGVGRIISKGARPINVGNDSFEAVNLIFSSKDFSISYKNNKKL